jgi:hypothetical protein
MRKSRIEKRAGKVIQDRGDSLERRADSCDVVPTFVVIGWSGLPSRLCYAASHVRLSLHRSIGYAPAGLVHRAGVRLFRRYRMLRFSSHASMSERRQPTTPDEI